LEQQSRHTVNATNLKKIEDTLGRTFRVRAHSGASTGTVSVASNTYDECQQYIGDYYTFRYSFDDPHRFVCAYCRIFWDDDASRLRFEELQRNTSPTGTVYEYEFKGVVCVYPSVKILQLLLDGSNVKRVVSVRPDDNKLIGVLQGFNETKLAGGFYPVATPIVYFKQEKKPDSREIKARIGVFEEHTPPKWREDVSDTLKLAAEYYLAPVLRR
jgi:hypothetical protein